MVKNADYFIDAQNRIVSFSSRWQNATPIGELPNETEIAHLKHLCVLREFDSKTEQHKNEYQIVLINTSIVYFAGARVYFLLSMGSCRFPVAHWQIRLHYSFCMSSDLLALRSSHFISQIESKARKKREFQFVSFSHESKSDWFKWQSTGALAHE